MERPSTSRRSTAVLAALTFAASAALAAPQAAAPRRPGAAKAPAGPSAAVRGVVTITGAKTNAWAVVTLESPALKAAAPLAEPVKIDQKGFRFLPHVVVVPTGSSIRFLNNDPEPHNVYSPEGRYNLGTWPTGDTRDTVFKKPGVYSQLCNIHPDMLAFVVVVDTPYYAVTDDAGNYVIRDVAPGKYTLVVWHEKKDGLEREVTVEAGKPLKLDLVVEK
ncbi:MAG: carboxypeptidase regulatory-like domain-containing protein [Vicinamibacteria bacterium]